MAALGLMVGFWLVRCRAVKAGEDPEKLADIIFYSMLGALVGARVLYVIRFYETEFAGNFWRIFKIQEGGIVFQGGFIGAIIVAWYCCRKRNFDFIKGLDIVAPALVLGHAFGRIGCFFNGCCYGGVCDPSLGVKFPQGSLPYNDQVEKVLISPFSASESLPVHPTQIYSFIAKIVIFIILMWASAKVKVKGHIFSLYLILYGVWRLAVEFLRDDQDRHLGLSVAQYIAVATVAVGVWLWVYFSAKQNKFTGVKDSGTV